MTLYESYPIHRCVYRDDEMTLKELLKNEEIKKQINEKDNHGNTPIHLALMLGRRNCIITLINNGCDIITRNNYGWNPLEESIFLGDVDIIEKISVLKIKTYIKTFGKVILKKWNDILPNFYFKNKIKFKCPISVLAKLLVSDTMELYKRDNCFRINTTIGGLSHKGIPRILKGNISFIIRFYEDTGDCKCFILDNKKKTYQEIYPNFPQWCMNNIIKSNINIKTLYKVFILFTDCIVKQKKGGLLKKASRSISMENGKIYKTDIVKIKDVKTVIRKRDNETVIGDYKSDIKSKVLNLTINSEKFSNISLNKNNTNSNESLISNDTASDNDEDSDDNEDSDNDSEYTINDKIDIYKEYNDSTQHESIFKKYIKNDTIDLETEKIITEILINGEDSEHNKVDTNDIAFLSSNYPDYIENLINKPISRKKYIQMLQHLNIEDKTDSSNNEYHSTLTRRNKIKVSEDPNVAFYRIISGIPSEEEEKQTEEVKNRIKNFDWNKNKITEEDYFNPSNTENLHMGRLMNISENTRSNRYIKLWMTQNNEFPISLESLEPVFEFINMIFFDTINSGINGENVLFGKKNEYLKCLFNEKRFPVRLELPIYPTVKMVIKNVDCSIDKEKIPQSLFEIPSDYVEDDIFFRIINK
ncbi:hypothetical protein BCR36DRAFT_347410 [Piromyces finnis]|uniref:Ankyrin repeat domain-containing protein n=1 Tax=Piromyces finnis TaxID=1754191 RepID=A0A1Y1VGD0_9FUNG|nr:hypothetical protein BCR36DRAFT_347410 [Piromyces finnis]|eukprot:ORX55484.1 hypothetical protein BCR36DRAFT_347410 [Piromyces finnis]